MNIEHMSKAENANQQNPWSHERVELIRRTICPRGIGDDEFSLFIEQCKRSGLDPLLKEAFCVARKFNAGSRERPVWSTRYEFQPSEAGMLARAERFPDFKGIQASAVYAEDEIVVDQGKGDVVHRFNPAKRKGSLAGAWARVVREEKLPVVVWLDFGGYVQQTPLWSKIPTTMIEKCARVAALRKAYPEAFGGLYVKEEMPAEEFLDPVSEESGKPPYEALGEQAPGAAKASFSKAAKAPEAPSHPAGQVAFGPHKGKETTALSDEELEQTLSLAREKLSENPKARWAKAIKANVASLEAEATLRERTRRDLNPQHPDSKSGALSS